MTSVRIEPHFLPGEYAALKTGAGLVDRSARARWRLSGARADEMLTGLVTNDVVALAVGQGQYAAVLTAKGKIVADVRILRVADALIVDVPALAAPGFAEVMTKYVNPRVTPYINETAATCALGVYGALAGHAVGPAFGIAVDALTSLPAYAHVTRDSCLIVRVPGVSGFEILAPADQRDALVRRLVAAGAQVCSTTTWDIVRVEAGSPEWGIDIDETTIPQEANLDEMGAISYTKGCYTGQETVARIHFRGHVNRHLRGVRLVGQRDALPPAKAALFDATGKPAGEVRTVVCSPRLGGIALGFVRREIALGDTVTVRWVSTEDAPGGEISATITPLPFPES
jgi:tRNA-modifying protein YgfZ